MEKGIPYDISDFSRLYQVLKRRPRKRDLGNQVLFSSDNRNIKKTARLLPLSQEAIILAILKKSQYS